MNKMVTRVNLKDNEHIETAAEITEQVQNQTR